MFYKNYNFIKYYAYAAFYLKHVHKIFVNKLIKRWKRKNLQFEYNFLQIIIDFYITEKYINKSLEDIYPGPTNNNLV